MTKKIVKIITDVGLYAIIVVGIVWGLPKGLAYYLDTQYPMATITSGSMWPALKIGDLVFIKNVAMAELKVGDIVVWTNKNGFTIHRVVKLDADTFVTKGDANFIEDAPVPYGDLVGRAILVGETPLRIPYVGLIAKAVNNWKGQP